MEAETEKANLKAAEDANGSEEENETTDFKDVVIEESQVGVYRVLVATVKGGFDLYKQFGFVYSALPLLHRLLADVYNQDRVLFTLYIVSRFWGSVENALLMQMSSDLLRTIETGLINREPFLNEVLQSLALRAVCGAVVSFLSWWSERLGTRLKIRVTRHFELYLMKVQLNLDVPTSLDTSSKVSASADSGWDAFSKIIEFLMTVVTALSHLAVIFNAARVSGDPMFLVVCLAKPLFLQSFNRQLWDKACYAFVNNVDYIRMAALKSLSGSEYREDVLNGNLGNWIINEYDKSRQKLGDVDDTYPFFMYERRNNPFHDMFSRILEDLPIMYCGLSAVFNPSRFTISSIAIFQQSSQTLRWTLIEIFTHSDQFRRDVAAIKTLYQASEIKNSVVGGKLAYPVVSEKGVSPPGMGFELRNINFAYPGSKSIEKALISINLKIRAGNVVVIVGGNGSGKSTLLRILSRMYDPSSGEFLIDGNLAKDYTLADLRRATTILSQENKLYPLSLGENIGLGCVESITDMDMVRDAAVMGGAEKVIAKLADGYDTVLDPMIATDSINIPGSDNHPLKQIMNKLDKKINVSGGERQRIVAARSFMRMRSKTIKFVAVDEPSSALDAEGELQLFNQLLEAREGKTLIFVTHRFGHLTKFADMILCMKDGRVAETGRHEELMLLNGEYAKLYKIQADAFNDSPADLSLDSSEVDSLEDANQ
ncbi:P-loop containing nucleoside triphosphate hydrolase protein [Coprinopsis marcescibilis]|uniref:P-loop containing nucleoside triphosphate hydrolase protein n=1 Tax=Coprinopsis marcescibilis TaxID=230819 RepID=A0A5C3KW90_COPMA|nr:P-loop containing nucleoside triphosphate hydrolase protein [Coprinopsis marcescibilis]